MAFNIFKIIKNFYFRYFKPRYFYIQSYLDELKFSSKNSKKIKSEINNLKEKSNNELKAVKKFHLISIFLYVGIYFSIINILLSDIHIIGDFVNFLRDIITFIGTPVFVLAQIIVTRLKNIRFEKLSLYTSHLISYSIKK